jgi:hypothetical protein
MAEHIPAESQKQTLDPVKARQGTGPRSMVTVLIVSTMLAAVATALLAYLMA